ncbi:C39 family peptidase [Jeotgalibacillus proteolyticus]|uniref:C39 family peptidase n=1 Tax=Jeotgalibacillus proteolyticus TaxID=2082395 RepID=UPI0014314ED5|nr:C39 family peptidase [Jeotgalibacillus proteolyticus]
MSSRNIIRHVQGFNQYEAELSGRGRKSACGPATMATIINYYRPSKEQHSKWLRKWYKESKANWLGLSAKKMIRSLSVYGTPSKIPSKRMWSEYRKEIDHGRPVGIKFDQWFSFKWFSTHYRYRYHWVTGIGYEEQDEKRYLLVLDNGTKKEVIRKIDFTQNAPILSMIAFHHQDKS